MLLDEATSALDSESQSLVKAGLRNLMKGRTVIVVAHRLETIKDADSILCIEEGSVAERGTHQELVQAGGLYSRLYREQIESTISNVGAVIDSTDALEALKAGVVDGASKS
uniref:ABC transporter domain-containing protein n=1 Tax=Alexandrium andersonii TaxID=327968 RepID=A0A7S2F622_9DINO